MRSICILLTLWHRFDTTSSWFDSGSGSWSSESVSRSSQNFKQTCCQCRVVVSVSAAKLAIPCSLEHHEEQTICKDPRAASVWQASPMWLGIWHQDPGLIGLYTGLCRCKRFAQYSKCCMSSPTGLVCKIAFPRGLVNWSPAVLSKFGRDSKCFAFALELLCNNRIVPGRCVLTNVILVSGPKGLPCCTSAALCWISGSVRLCLQFSVNVYPRSSTMQAMTTKSTRGHQARLRKRGQPKVWTTNKATNFMLPSSLMRSYKVL